jgi:2-methylisocitrate lyase-like PEP mutase family enzyme
MRQSEKAERFRKLHEEPKTLLLPNPWDAGSAKALEALGFEAMTTTSAGLAWTLGRTDGTRSVSRDEALANAKSIVDATSLPVAADLENGYGDDPQTVAETVKLAARAGLVGCSIEDATGGEDRPVYDFDFAVERVAAAAAAARSLPFPFMLVARAENFCKASTTSTIRFVVSGHTRRPEPTCFMHRCCRMPAQFAVSARR